MKAQIIHSFGDSSVFQLEEVAKPKLLPGHVLIHVKATSVNPIDTEITQIVEEGKLRPLLDSTSFTFDEVAQAHEYLESNKAIGKIVLKNVW
ncbi:zinc-binding dehydrogenase family protein [Bacillus cereus 03BB102]|uniref:Zinc-binding dehydrogenase family protein n=2 Tax=Bacillus cereus TaxID=1396 RepID=A0AAN0T248_BACCE|nr:NADPH:quinone reductase [Bacillus cereus 03BB102]AJH71274.1 zinc-binding dehydrogenase family protein [Bacillus thuringiensis]AJI14227.1 zinc-binding dehydrogenase family protein [Bacillus cereus 03BB108]EEK55490.1 Quinone oxidoreductase [Bacillus cereus BGSC 6E1]MBP3972686.1 zinc-binding dehydrogenase [Bacillus sp. WL1]OOZ84122.1 quinone oxidoreductase [Bacillus cereus]